MLETTEIVMEKMQEFQTSLTPKLCCSRPNIGTNKTLFALWVVLRALSGVGNGIFFLVIGLNAHSYTYSAAAVLIYFLWSLISFSLTAMHAFKSTNKFYWEVWLIVEAIELTCHVICMSILSVLYQTDVGVEKALVGEGILTAIYGCMWSAFGVGACYKGL